MPCVPYLVLCFRLLTYLLTVQRTLTVRRERTWPKRTCWRRRADGRPLGCTGHAAAAAPREMWQPSRSGAPGPGLSSDPTTNRDAHSSGQLPRRAAMSVSEVGETNGQARTSMSAKLIFRVS